MADERRKRRRDSVLEPKPIRWKRSTEPILGDQEKVAPILDDRSAAAAAPTDPAAREDAAPQAPRAVQAEVAERVTRGLLVAAVFIVPVVFDPRTVDAFNLAKVTALWTLVVAAAAAWTVVTIFDPRSSRRPWSPLVLASVVLAGVTALATLLSTNRGLSLFGLYHRYEGLVSLLMYVAILMLIVLAYRRRPERLRELLMAAGAAAGVVGAYVVVQQLGLDPFQWRAATGDDPARPIGSLGNSFFTGAYLGMAVPVLVFGVTSAWSRAGRVAWLGVGGMALWGLALTGGRGGILAAAAGTGAMVLFATRTRPWPKVAAVGVALLVLGLVPVFSPSLIDPPESEARVEHRTDIWLASLRMVADRPVLGWGPESFYGQHPPFRTATEARRQGLMLSDKPHNAFLGRATASGIAGLATYLSLAGLALLVLARRAAASRDPERMILLAFGGVLVAYLVQAMYSVDIPPLALMGWLGLAGIAAMAKSDGGTQEPAAAWSPERGRPHQALALVAPAAALALIVAGFGPLRADHAAREAERRGGPGWSAQASQLYESAMRLNPREPAYYALAGSYLERVATQPGAPYRPEDAYLRAAELYEEAFAKQPGNLHFMIAAARVYSYLAELEDVRFFVLSDAWLEQAVSHNPLDPQTHDLRADLLGLWADASSGEEAEELRRRAAASEEAARQLRTGRVSP